ncbi:hypothetical protein B0H14DRAFT_2854910 [Mycena olivaceomarginata]|nr:hypothetical protein B0H14DRAFT_2854910 [Mycena olivaceomarginata]
MPSTSFNSRTYKDSTDVEEDPPPPRPQRPEICPRYSKRSPLPLHRHRRKSPGKLAKRHAFPVQNRVLDCSGSGSGGGSKNSSTSSILSRTPSLPNAFKPPNPPPPSPTKPAEAKQSPMPRPKMTGRTYAGTSRSFLSPFLSTPPPWSSCRRNSTMRFASRESYTSLREGKGKDSTEPVPLANGMMNPLKSITELRNQGESRRFLDEVGYLWEGLDKSGGLGLRRASALEITTKLCESEFARKAKAADFIGPTWDLLRTAGGGQGEDRASPSLYASFSDLAQRPSSSLTSTLFSLLETSSPSSDPLTCISDAAQLRKLGLSKKDQYLLTTIHTAISNASLFPDSTGLSISLLASHCLTSLPSSILAPTPTNMKVLLSTLRSHLSPLLASPMSTFIVTSLYWLSEGLLALGVYMEAVNSGRNGGTERENGLPCHTRHECSLVTLRLLVGLTHSDPVWCRLTKDALCFGFILRATLRGHSTRLGKVKREQSAGPTNGNGNAAVKVEEDSDEESDAAKTDGAEEALDTLCLALGLLTNLVQVDEGQNTLRETYCLTACKCAHQITALELLPTPPLANVNASPPQSPRTPASFWPRRNPNSSLATCRSFGLLMLDNAENQATLLAFLPLPAPVQISGDTREFVYIYSGAEDGDAAKEGGRALRER